MTRFMLQKNQILSLPRLNPLVASYYHKLEVFKMTCIDLHNLITHHLHPLLWEPQIPFSFIKVLCSVLLLLLKALSTI